MSKKKIVGKSKGKSKSQKKSNEKSSVPIIENKWFRESAGILLLAVSLFVILSLLSEISITGSGKNSCGPIGHSIADFLWWLTGVPALLFPVVLTIIGLISFRHRKLERKRSRIIGLILLFPSLSLIFSLYAKAGVWTAFQYNPGGIIGKALGQAACRQFGIIGATIFSYTAALISLLIVTDISYYILSKRLKSFLVQHVAQLLGFISSQYDAWKERRLCRKEEKIERKSILESGKKEKSTPKTETVSVQTTPIISVSDELLNTGLEPAAETVSEADEKDEHCFLKTKSDLYEKPHLGLLDDPVQLNPRESDAELIRKSKLLITKLGDFNIQGRITEVCPGPVITRYDFEPAPGIKISRITGLADDLALGLKSRFGLRVAPIPGKSSLGIEIPNQHRETVFLKELLRSEEFIKASQQSILSLPLGKTTSGVPYISDLKRMPHLLIAGATGSGKSVCINSILCGLLFSTTPENLRLLLIDPKMLELSDFNGIAHLREPVITDVKLAPDALNWALDEMNKRYQKLSMLGVRNIDQFNAKVSAPDYEGEEKPLPYMIIVIDELADLMLTAASSVEESIQRLAQMARASGIHLIIATQRPSVDVITGVIKANLPCRLAFQVASKIDSRTILDSQGAEKLLGMGDCLFLPPGTSRIIRLHGAYVSEKETKRVVAFLRNQAALLPEEESIFRVLETNKVEMDESEDPLYNEAVKLVLTNELASISMLQRRLKVGHSRASRLIDTMELNGIVGKFEGSKPREILVDRDEFLERLKQIEEDNLYAD